MKTKRLNLRAIEAKDAKLIATWKNNSHIELEEQGIINNHAPYYMLTITETNEPIGYIRIQWMNEDKTCAMLKFHLGLYKGQGYMKEALETFIPTLFEQGVYRIESEVYAYNTSNYKLLKALNFEHEGTRRQAYYENGKYHDIYLFGLIKQTPSTNLQDYLDYVLPYYKNKKSLYSMIHNLAMFDHQALNLSNLYFLISFHKLLTPLQQDLNFMRQTLFKLSSLNWNSDQIKDVLFSLERQLITPISEEEKIVHDLYHLEKIDAQEIAKALEQGRTHHQLLEQIQNKNFNFCTKIGKEIGEERIAYTKKYLQEL